MKERKKYIKLIYVCKKPPIGDTWQMYILTFKLNDT